MFTDGTSNRTPYACKDSDFFFNDHYLLKEVHLPQNSTLAMDRAYIDYAQFQRLTEEGVCYVTKMKKNLKYKELSSVAYVSKDGLVTHTDMHILFEKGELKHEARKVELWSNNSKKSVVLLTNNFELSVEDLEEIYKRRWAIETTHKDDTFLSHSWKIRTKMS